MEILKKGFKAHKQEAEKIQKERELKSNGLFRLYFRKDMEDGTPIPIRFLTDEPISFYEHDIKENGRYKTVTCIGTDNDCPLCKTEEKNARLKGAFLILDRGEYEVDERDENNNKTGRKVVKSNFLKLLVRGQKDLQQLEIKKQKTLRQVAKNGEDYSMLNRDFLVYKTGAGTSTLWSFEEEEPELLTDAEIQNMLPEKFRGRDFYEILEEQILNNIPSGVDLEDEDDEEEEVVGVIEIEEEKQKLPPRDKPIKRTLTRSSKNKK